MKIKRRVFLKGLGAIVIGTAILSFDTKELFATKQKKVDIENGIKVHEGFYIINKQTQKSVAALAETFLPGSKDIKLIDSFMDYFSKKENHGIGSFFDAGFWNLDTISQSKFKVPYYQLKDKAQKDEVINHIRARNEDFLIRFEKLTKQLYYSHPKILKKQKKGSSSPQQPKSSNKPTT